eukprot:10882713-Alexandrium_andersonii.AAC.1
MRSPGVVSVDGAAMYGRVGSPAKASRSHSTHGGTANGASSSAVSSSESGSWSESGPTVDDSSPSQS